jgi:hypothetical protein
LRASSLSSVLHMGHTDVDVMLCEDEVRGIVVGAV